MIDWEIIIRLVASMVIGGLVGAQREFKKTSAGFRTHTLVAVGACIAMVVNEYLFKTYSSMSNMDIARMGSYVISGIGFLGAGSIIKSGFRIQGLTTAAGLWVVACLGIAVGAGLYVIAIAGTILVVLTLTLLKIVEEKFLRRKNRTQIDLNIKNSSEQIMKVLSSINSIGLSIHSINIRDINEKWLDFSLYTSLQNKNDIDGIRETLAKIEGVKVIDIDPT